MNKDEFLALDPKAKGAACQKEFDEGKSYEDILAGLGINKKELEKQGVYFVKNKFMVKLMPGYATTGTGKDILQDKNCPTVDLQNECKSLAAASNRLTFNHMHERTCVKNAGSFVLNYEY